MLIATLSWAATAALAALHLRTRRRLVLVARASHELRGPLCAVQLGLHGLAGEPTRVAALELELRRAGRALEDLAAAPSGARGVTRPELVDLAALATAYAPAWRALAATHGAQFQLEPPAAVTRYHPAAAPTPAVASAAPAGREAPRAAAAAAAAVAGAAPAGREAPRAAAAAAAVAGAAPAGREARRAAAAQALAAAAGRGARRRSPSSRPAVPSTAVFADPLRIAQACANLVGNAAEHGGGVVRVRVRAVGGQVRIEVADDGPGLPAAVSALTASARGHRGRRGHGLAIAAAIAEHHGGRLAAAPSQAGARLMLEVPAARSPVVA